MSISATKVKGILSSKTAFDQRFVPNLEELQAITKTLKDSGHRVVLTQGVFDLIHEGHARYLELAREEGDVLIVGVDTDEVTRKRKGPSRPVVPQAERLQMLAFLRSVDVITLRVQEEVEKDIDFLHKMLRPDVFVMSTSTKDFPLEKKQEIEQYVGKVVIFEPQAETSSTARIRHLMIEGVTGLETEINKAIKGYYSKVGVN
jgi:rfaE bifunctional protein nucleotidyltransferase chain/domain